MNVINLPDDTLIEEDSDWKRLDGSTEVTKSEALKLAERKVDENGTLEWGISYDSGAGDWDVFFRPRVSPAECCGTPSTCQSPPCPEAATVNMQYQVVDIEFDQQFSGIACPPPTERPNRRSITGSIRDNREGKGRYDLESPISRRILVEALEKGADKYEAHNWSLGQPVSWYYDSASRHLTNWWASGDTSDLHAAYVNLHMLVHTDEMLRRRRLPEELNDRPDYDAEVRPE